jgi:hypothetical protein
MKVLIGYSTDIKTLEAFVSKGKVVERWANQTDNGQNKLSPSANRWLERSKTYPGIAAAMGHQWG